MKLILGRGVSRQIVKGNEHGPISSSKNLKFYYIIFFQMAIRLNTQFHVSLTWNIIKYYKYFGFLSKFKLQPIIFAALQNSKQNQIQGKKKIIFNVLTCSLENQKYRWSVIHQTVIKKQWISVAIIITIWKKWKIGTVFKLTK